MSTSFVARRALRPSFTAVPRGGAHGPPCNCASAAQRLTPCSTPWQLYRRQQQAQYAQQAQYGQRAQQEALLRAQREALLAQARAQQGGGYGSDSPYGGGSSFSGGSKPPLTKKQQKELKKKQEKEAKTLKELQKANAKLRQKAQSKSRYPSASSSRRAVSSKRGGGPLSFVFSMKGFLTMGAAVAAYLFDKNVLMGKLLKYPTWFASWFLRALWTIGVKPVVRFIVMRGKGGGGALPGGSY